MPRVPQKNIDQVPSARPTPFASGARNTAVVPNQAAAGGGFGSAQVFGQASQIGENVFKISGQVADIANKYAVNKAAQELFEARSEAMSIVSNAKGEDSLNARKEAQAFFKKRVGEIQGGLSNFNQIDAFQGYARGAMSNVVASAEAHASKEMQKLSLARSKVLRRQLSDEYVSVANSDAPGSKEYSDALLERAVEMEGELTELRYGKDEVLIGEAKKQARSELILKRIQSLTDPDDGNMDTAKQAIADNLENLTPDDIDKAKSLIERVEDIQFGPSVSGKLMEKHGGDVIQALKEVNTASVDVDGFSGSLTSKQQKQIKSALEETRRLNGLAEKQEEERREKLFDELMKKGMSPDAAMQTLLSQGQEPSQQFVDRAKARRRTEISKLLSLQNKREARFYAEQKHKDEVLYGGDLANSDIAKGMDRDAYVNRFSSTGFREKAGRNWDRVNGKETDPEVQKYKQAAKQQDWILKVLDNTDSGLSGSIDIGSTGKASIRGRDKGYVNLLMNELDDVFDPNLSTRENELNFRKVGVGWDNVYKRAQKYRTVKNYLKESLDTSSLPPERKAEEWFNENYGGTADGDVFAEARSILETMGASRKDLSDQWNVLAVAVALRQGGVSKAHAAAVAKSIIKAWK